MVKTGKIIKPDNCEKCSDDSKKIIAHHYLKIKWVCPKCHGILHKIYGTKIGFN